MHRSIPTKNAFFVTIYLGAFVNKLSIAHFNLYSKYNCFLFDSIQCSFIQSYILSHSELLFQNAFIDTISIQCSFFIHFIFLVIDCFKVFKAGKMHCRKSNGKNRPNEKLNRTKRKNKCYRIKWKKCRCYCYCCWLFYNIISTMDYLCKLIESNKNTCIVNRCLPLNYREISWMHLSSIWNVKCRKNLKNRLNFFCLFSVLLCFSFFRLLFSFCSIWKRSIVFLMLPSSLVHPCFLLFLAFLCSFLDMKSNETNNTSQCQHGFKCVQLFKIPYFFLLLFDFIDVDNKIVLHTISVDKCEMLGRLTLKWIQHIVCCYLFEWLQRRIIMAHSKLWHLKGAFYECTDEILNYFTKT